MKAFEKQRVVLVSGGSRGLGAALVSDQLERGYTVATFSRTRSAFVDECTARYGAEGRFSWQELDASDSEGVRRLPMTIAKRYGRLDALVNSAGVNVDALLCMMHPENIDKILDVNLKSVLYLTQGCSKVMIARRSGVIVNISSVNAVRGHRGVTVYSATKAALDGLTRSLARELGECSIRVNSVAPGYFDSEMTANISPQMKESIARRTPLKRMATLADIVGVVEFLLSDAAGFITGQTLVVDGGLTC